VPRDRPEPDAPAAAGEPQLDPEMEAALAAMSPEERAQAMARADPLEYFAGRFALKEAVFKALGLDPDSVHLAQIAVLDDASGKPAAAFGPRLAPLVPAGAAVHVSLSHDAGRALAVAVIEAGPPAA
jgi:phosphopantetheine--protein transferase-like protein